LSTSDHYQLLGVERDADRRTIRVAYRKALRRHHPDANAGSRAGERILLQVIAAGRVLRDPKLRARYDRQFEKRPRQQYRKPAAKKTSPQINYQKLLLTCQRIFHSGKQAWRIFFNAEQAKAAEARAARQRKRNPPGFNFYLHLATNSNNPQQYQHGADGIYRKASPHSRPESQGSWRKRTAVWLLIGIILLRI
jgi:DnaJ-class molecular chaperone